MGPIGCPETPVRNYHYTLRNNPAELRFCRAIVQQWHTIGILIQSIDNRIVTLCETLLLLCFSQLEQLVNLALDLL